ncbi:unnamed protein product [Darwinula stevensoni]|uniref:Uncharacterized protein n=1 Tax=Darwinula stevensoni TaxID=69355 RepID=A0A7R8XAQ4_9CRUS|nr:unnamed protein product [Darwinula stevensoni]CAG0891609.1 unnamed protein product [Darwinula stevensoni]
MHGMRRSRPWKKQSRPEKRPTLVFRPGGFLAPSEDGILLIRTNLSRGKCTPPPPDVSTRLAFRLGCRTAVRSQSRFGLRAERISSVAVLVGCSSTRVF